MSSKKNIKVIGFINNRTHRRFLFEKLDCTFMPMKNVNTIPCKIYAENHTLKISKNTVKKEKDNF